MQPILGSDFLDHYDLTVDCRKQQLTRGSNPLPPPAFTLTIHAVTGIKIANPADIVPLLQSQFPNVLKRSIQHTQKDVKTSHFLVTSCDRPIRQPRRELDPVKRTAAEAEFRHLEEAGIIRRSTSPWASPLHMVLKKDGTYRPCGDYRMLNNVTVHDSYPTPLVTDILHRLNGAAIFSTIDLERAYHQIPVAADDIPKTAVITPFGLFEYLRMPFGLRNAGQTFQRHIDQVLIDMPYAIPYIDDILIASPDEATHKTHLEHVFHRLNENNLQVNINKCSFFKTEAVFLGLQLTPHGHSPLPERLETIKQIPKPSTVTELRSFLGTINFCHRYIPHCSEILSPLSALSQGPKKSQINWTDKAEQAFTDAKTALLHIPTLHYPKRDAPFILTTDASTIAAGAMLAQSIDGTIAPIEFFSRKFNSAEQRYSTFDRELLAMILSVKHFKHFLEGHVFKIRTDHKPLIHMMSMKNPSPRQERHISFLSEFSFQIEHITGKDNTVADFFSRTGISIISFDPIFTEEILRLNPPHEDDITFFKTTETKDGIYYNTILNGCPRPILAENLRKQAFDTIHNIHHPGSKATARLLSSRVCWPRMLSDIKRWTKECLLCQQYKVNKTIQPPILHYPTGSRFETIHMDIVGPLPECNGYQYILTILDRKTRWPEAIPIRQITTQSVVAVLLNTWIARFGVPKNIITDQGTQFESAMFNQLTKSLGSKHIHTSPYHPQANGLIERFHRTLKSSLRILCQDNKNWLDALPIVLLGWRNTPNTSTDASPAQLLFGSHLTFPQDLVSNEEVTSIPALNQARNHFLSIDTNPAFHNNHKKPMMPKNLKEASFVWLKSQQRHGFEPYYTGPYKLIETTERNAKILRDNAEHIVHLSNVKPAFGYHDSDTEDLVEQDTEGKSEVDKLRENYEKIDPFDMDTSVHDPTPVQTETTITPTPVLPETERTIVRNKTPSAPVSSRTRSASKIPRLTGTPQ